PTSNFFREVRMFAHLGSHLALGHAVWAGKVKLERIDTGFLNDLRQLLPAIFAVLLHDGSDQNIVWIFFLYLLELFEPDFYRSIRNQLDILKPDHLVVFARAQLAITRDDVNHLARFQTDGLGDRATPACVVGFR